MKKAALFLTLTFMINDYFIDWCMDIMGVVLIIALYGLLLWSFAYRVNLVRIKVMGGTNEKA